MATKTKMIIKITKSLNKKGKIKGSNKKETKRLKGGCQHHDINKKGKVRPRVFSNDGEYLICTMCKKKFLGRFYTNDEIETTVDDFEMLNNQNKYTAVAINAGEHTADYFSQVGMLLAEYPKAAKKVRNIAEKQSSVKKNKNRKNKGNGSNGGSASYGSWGQKG